LHLDTCRREEDMMNSGHGTLANLERRLLAEFDRHDRFQTPRILVSPAKWSIWKRYAPRRGSRWVEASPLIDRELAMVAETSSDGSPVVAQRVREQPASREAELANREQAMAAEKRLRSGSEQLCRWETERHVLAQRVRLASRLAAQRDGTPKVGRNDPCPGGSGLK
jgi:hypothetical protein